MPRTSRSTVRLLLLLCFGLLALAAIGLAAYAFVQTPQACRDGRPAVILAICGCIFAVTFLAVAGGRPAIEFLGRILRNIL